MTNAWFRFYSETLRDRKLERIARVTGHPKALLMGVWVTLLALANDSPERGILLLTDDIPLTFDDLCLETGTEPETLTPIVDRFLAMEMLSFEDGIYFITNWGKRQFKSDSSIDRVRRYRVRQAEKKERNGNDDVTLQDEPCNAPESESESESETEADTLPASSDYLKIRAVYLEVFSGKPKPRATTQGHITKAARRMEDAYFEEKWEAALRRAARGRRCHESGWFDIAFFLKNDTNWEKCLNGNYDNEGADKKTGAADGWKLHG